MGEPKGQSNGAKDLGRDWDLPEPIVLTLGGSKSSPPILFISQTLGDLWTCKASGLQPRLDGGGRPFHWRRVRLIVQKEETALRGFRSGPEGSPEPEHGRSFCHISPGTRRGRKEAQVAPRPAGWDLTWRGRNCLDPHTHTH